jgi:Mg-chelatase subunit ChlD
MATLVDLDERPAVPKSFDQLGILVLDGSSSMGGVTADGKLSKAQAVNSSVRDLLTRLKASRVKANFSMAVVTFDSAAKRHTDVTPVADIDDYAEYDPMIGHGGGTDIGEGLRCAGQIAKDFLSKWKSGALIRIGWNATLPFTHDGGVGVDARPRCRRRYSRRRWA